MINIFENDSYKFYLVIPAIMFLVALTLIPSIPYGIDLRGGTSITALVQSELDLPGLEADLNALGLQQVSTRKISDPISGETGVIVEFGENPQLIKAHDLIESNPTQAKALVQEFVDEMPEKAFDAVELASNNQRKKALNIISSDTNIPVVDLSVQEFGPSLSQLFWEQGQRALLFAFVLMGVIVFVAFRQIIPSSLVIGAAFFDIVFALGVMGLFGVPLSLSTIAAILMLIGYSVDTDIMLTTNVLKEKGDTDQKIMKAMGTGLTMTGTTLFVLLILAVASFLSQITILFQIASVLLFGLIGDLASTWLMNAVILKWWKQNN